MKTQEIKYYDNDEKHGIIIDWNAVFREFRKLKVPKDVYDPTTVPITSAKYIQLLSERSTGKTTNWLLIGMILYQMYGTITQYIRQTEDMIKPSIAGEIFKVILEYGDGKYIKAITNDKYNSIYIHWKKAYFCNKDENGKIIEQDPNNFLQFLSIDNNFDYKSTYNAPKGDLILYDEFIGKFYRPNEYVDFMDLLSTIIRKRKTPVVVMLANSINYNSMYFKEFEISKEVKQIKTGQSKLITTEKGTTIYFEIIGLKLTAIKTEINRLFFGFNNPKLASITGGEQTWAFDPVPHIVNDDTDVYITRILRLDCDDVMLQLDVVRTEDRGLIVNVHECTRLYEDSIILTNGEIRQRNQLFGLGRGKLCKKVWELYKQNKFYYDSNETGSLVENYVKTYLQIRK